MRELNLLSVIVPCHNEQEVLPGTHRRLSGVLKEIVNIKQCSAYEIVYVNNGSTDQTRQVLREIFNADPRARVIELRRNFGYQGSLSAGLFFARGDAVVSIDADLQDPPEKIAAMIDFYRQDYDLVLGVRAGRSSDSPLKRFFAQKYYCFLKAVGVEVVYNHGDFRLMARALVDEFNRLDERNRFIRAMVLKLDNYYATVSYDRQPRQLGKTKFDVRSLFSLSLDGILSFSYAPLRLASFLGLVMCIVAVLMIGWVIVIRVKTDVVPGWASTLLPVLLFSSVQLFVLGIIGEYIGRLYIEVKQRPVFSVRREYSH